MPRSNRSRFGFAAATVVLATMAAFPAMADVQDYTLGVSNITPSLDNFGTVDVNLTGGANTNLAVITFTSNTASGYYFTDGGSAAVNSNGTATLSAITGNQTGNAGCSGNACYSNGGSGNEDGFGSFSNSVNTMGSFANRSSTITFDLTLSSGTWANAAAVLTANAAGGYTVAAHIGELCTAADVGTNALCSGGAGSAFRNTGFVADGTTVPVPVPEPASLAILGAALASLGAIRMRRRRDVV